MANHLAASDNQISAQPAMVQKTAEPVTESIGVIQQQENIQLLAGVGGTEQAQNAQHVHSAAAEGTSGSGSELPHLNAIQKSFGRYDVSHVQAYTGSKAAAANKTLGSQAYA